MRIFVCLFLTILGTSLAHAEALVDLGATYSGDTLTHSPNSTSTQYFYNADVLFNLDRRGQWSAGFAVLGISKTGSENSISTSYSSMDFGPAVRWSIDKRGIFSITAAYGYVAKASYSSGSTSEKWEGTSLLGQFAVQAPLESEKFFVGVSLNYYAANYSKKVVNTVESSNSAAKSWIFPMISLTWRP